MTGAPATTLRQIPAIAAVDAARWNALAGANPFLQHAYLHALEASGSVGDDSGWQPAHVVVESGDALLAAAPLYLKQHSYGEFVFDFAWANAYHRCGLDYYPKLVCAVPYAPVAGARLLARDAATRQLLARALAELPGRVGASSLHALFADQRDLAALREAGALTRRDCHYLWRNRGYRHFDDYLGALSSKRRKEIRRERRRCAEAGIGHRVVAPEAIDDALWDRLYALYARTYFMRGQHPYLTPAFFRHLGAAMPEAVRYVLALRGGEVVAMAFMLEGADTLYGRHWGCAEEFDALHFETCYYAGIDYCIRRGLRYFDAGAQGEHKIHRGFEPVATWSAHVVEEPRLRAAIADFLTREQEMLAGYHAQQRARCAFPADAERAP